ncbi:hypothetical protein NP493_4g02025 [Ridgeia piscesae]|uniref:DNA mismatch repair proteins mutS family domain-containing protein n=1 Tax=Ridgeia piscesae TaxID=27915 RepID=A0AAD9PG57_RIDPI|nr:hypothetical protein NP493_4g02025 [Ridgeia piscesae]
MSLELLQNTRDVKSDHTLFGTLNYTRTPMGARLLRCNILQPPNNLETVSMRLDAVAELTDNEELFYSLQAVVGRFLDVDHLLSLCIQIPKQETVKTAESKITNMIHLKHSLELVEPLQLALKDSHSKLLCAYALVLEDPRFNVIMEKIHCVINEDTVFQKGLLNMRTQKCFAVKPHINGLLDVARRTYTEIVDDIAEMVEQLRNEYSLPMTSAYNSTRGFHLQIHSHSKEELPGVSSLPPCFIKVTRSKNSLTFTNTDLVVFIERVKESLQEIYLMTNIVVTELLTDIRVHLGCLYKLTECISMIDMIVAFAHNCTLFHYVRPEFTDTIAIKQGRHPILEKITVDAITPNNVVNQFLLLQYASEESNFVVITGPNMSGKSTYLRQIALLQIMAQIGSYVPAEYASFRLTDQIFSRIGSDDDIETNASTFVMEMRETNYIVQNATASSLIIIDELGRGTSADEGVGICHAICEYLLNLKAYVFFATHFMQLTNLESLYPNVENYHFDVQEVFGEHGQCSKVTYTHVLSKGKTRQKHYGLQLAEMSTLPAEVLQDARCLAEQISAQRETKAPLSAAAVKERADFRLSKRLLQTALNSRLDEESLRSYLRALKEQYLKELQESVTSAED